MRNKTSKNIDIFQDEEYKPLKNVCDAVFKRLHAKGIGTKVRATIVLSPEDEDTLWTSGVLDTDTPKGLLNADFFIMAKIFASEEDRSNEISNSLKLRKMYVYLKEEKLAVMYILSLGPRITKEASTL